MTPSFSLTLKPSDSAASPLFYFISACLPHGTPPSHHHLNCSSLCVFFKKVEASCGDFPFSIPWQFLSLYVHVDVRHLVQVWIFADDHAVDTVCEIVILCTIPG